MMRLVICVIALGALACGRSAPDAPATSGSSPTPPSARSEDSNASKDSKESKPRAPGDGVAYFAGGCFWGVEHYMAEIDGVTHVDSGYMGGNIESPTYEQVGSQTSGHLESVRVRYHTGQVSYETIARRFFEIHDPTQADGQGPDLGPEYLSAVFYTSAEEERTSKALIARLEARGYKVATKLIPATTFWPAEDYHQDYYEKKGGTPYCHRRVKRFGDD